MEQLAPTTCSSLEHQQTAYRRTEAPTTELPVEDITVTSSGIGQGCTTDTSRQLFGYLPATEECPRKTLDDLLWQWWHDEDSHLDSSGEAQAGRHAEQRA